MVLGFLTPVVETIMMPVKGTIKFVGGIITNTKDGIVKVIGDGYNGLKTGLTKVADRGRILLDEAGQGAKRLANATIEKTGQALDAGRRGAQSTAKYLGEKGTQAAGVVGDAVKKGAHLAGDLTGKAFDAAKAFNKDPSTGRTLDYVPTFQLNPANQVGEMFTDMGVEAQELIEGTQDALVNTFNFLMEGKLPPKKQPQMQVVHRAGSSRNALAKAA